MSTSIPPFPAYSGAEPYVFVCYSHGDASMVYPEITRLREQGINIWYDEGISPGEVFTDELADAILHLENNPDICQDMGRRARALFERDYDKSIAIERWRRILES